MLDYIAVWAGNRTGVAQDQLSVQLRRGLIGKGTSALSDFLIEPPTSGSFVLPSRRFRLKNAVEDRADRVTLLFRRTDAKRSKTIPSPLLEGVLLRWSHDEPIPIRRRLYEPYCESTRTVSPTITKCTTGHLQGTVTARWIEKRGRRTTLTTACPSGIPAITIPAVDGCGAMGERPI